MTIMKRELFLWGVPVVVSLIGLVLSIVSLARAARADRRSERTERLERVQFEISRAQVQPGLYRLFNVGTDPVTDVALEASSVLGVTFNGPRVAAKLNPTEYMTFTLRSAEPGVNVPVSLRVTWSGPFKGERWVLLPEDPRAPWAGVIWSALPPQTS